MNVDQYKEMVYKITKVPKSENTIWAKKSKLCMLFIEFRDMDIIKYNLWNIANVYGGGDTCLVIVYSGDNKDIIMKTTKDWKNVRYIQAMDKNESVKAYDTLITSYDFWDKFSEFEHVLTNTWDSYIFKRIPEKFFKYDIVGGPCGHYYIVLQNRLTNICSMTCKCDRCLSSDHIFKADNFKYFPYKYTMLCGGFYLRKVETTKRLCKSKKHMGEPDDIYFAISNLSRPSIEEASEFGVQDFVYDGIPVGCHQLWPKHTEEYIRQLFKRGCS
tara:strand:+ start:80 stop:895 length:816 start_codon:yes stop_codon:yes gene_type:complete